MKSYVRTHKKNNNYPFSYPKTVNIINNIAYVMPELIHRAFIYSGKNPFTGERYHFLTHNISVM